MLFLYLQYPHRTRRQKEFFLSLDERVDIHTPKIRYMAHRLPIMSYAVGGDENKLRGYIRVLKIKATG